MRWLQIVDSMFSTLNSIRLIKKIYDIENIEQQQNKDDTVDTSAKEDIIFVANGDKYEV